MKRYQYVATTIWGRQTTFIGSCWPTKEEIFNHLLKNDLFGDLDWDEIVKGYKIKRRDGAMPQEITVVEVYQNEGSHLIAPPDRIFCSIIARGEV